MQFCFVSNFASTLFCFVLLSCQGTVSVCTARAKNKELGITVKNKVSEDSFFSYSTFAIHLYINSLDMFVKAQ